MRFSVSVAGLVVSSYTRAQEIPKPAAWSNLDFISPRINQLPRVSATISRWISGNISRGCRSAVLDTQKDPTQFTSYTVTFADCSQPWLICQEKGSSVTIEEVVAAIARTPVGLRQWVNDIVTFKDGAGGNLRYSTVMSLFGPSAKNTPVVIHEAMHAAGFYAGVGMYWDAQEWRDAYNKDSHVADNYARTNHIENFAQYASLIIYDRVTNKDLQTYPQYNQIVWQIRAQAQGADRTNSAIALANVSKKCNRRWPLEPAVDPATGAIIDNVMQAQFVSTTDIIVDEMPAEMLRTAPVTNCTFGHAI